MSRPAISVENLSKRYQIGLREARHTTFREAIMQTAAAPLSRLKRLSGGVPESETFWALRDVSFEVQPGEVVGIIGRNGAGKSTLLKVLSRITEPTSGRAVIRGRVGSLLEVGTGFHTELTGRENVFLNGSILGMSRREIDRKFDEIVDFSGVEKFIDTPVKRYSSGMTVRLGFAVAAHLEPEILIVDEVLAVGDAEFQKRCIGKMQDVAGSGRTVLFVSHNMAAVTRLCSRAIVLKSGAVRFDGIAAGGISRYLEQVRQPDRQWSRESAPGNSIVRLSGVRVTDDEGRATSAVDVGTSVFIEMDYDVLTPGHVLVPNAHVYLADGTCAFVSHDVDPHWRGRAKARGRYISRLQIPGNLLNEGWLTIGAAVTTYRPFQVHFFEREAVCVEVTETGTSNAARGDYAGNMPGVIRPHLDWKTEFLPESDETADSNNWIEPQFAKEARG